MAKPVLVATGFNREVRTLPTEGVLAVAGGGDAAALERNLSALAPKAAGIVSYGLTGALHDDLRIGDWIVGSRICGGVDLQCDPVWSEALASRLPKARIGGFFADGRMIDTVAEKRDLGRCHAALAVDMESHVAARVARAHDLPFAIVRIVSDEAGHLPFAIVRIVSDEAGHLLPHAITVCMKPDGSLNIPLMLKSLASKPAQIADVAKTMANFARGFSGLKAGAHRIGARMAFPR